MSNLRIFIIIVICSACTFAERFFPFAVFGKHEVPPIVKYLGNVLPTAVMATLVVYCLRGIDFGSIGGCLPQLIAVAVTAVLHLWRSNTFLSVGGGTAVYMILLKII